MYKWKLNKNKIIQLKTVTVNQLVVFNIGFNVQSDHYLITVITMAFFREMTDTFFIRRVSLYKYNLLGKSLPGGVWLIFFFLISQAF